jgi:hypothetical protein
MNPCYCGRLYTCEDCGSDVCQCTCELDGAPQTQAEVTAGYVNPSQARQDAWALKLELTR